VETITAALEVIGEPFRSMATTLVEMCAYAGTGNVLKVQHFLHICSEHYDAKDSGVSEISKICID
jgi:26S proteasome regulatory subunit N1